MKYQGVFFDFDYTLGDSTMPIVIGYQRGFEALGWPPPSVEQVKGTIGMTLMDGYELLTGDGDAGRKEEFYHLFRAAVGEEEGGTGDLRVMVEETRLFPGAVELLSALKKRGIRVAIVSTKPRMTIERILAWRGLTHLADLIVGDEDVKRFKPDPEGLNFAMDRLGLTVEQVLFCGDTVIDAAAARNAGVEFCAVLNGTTPREAFGDYPCVHIAEDLPHLHHWLNL